MKRKQNEHEVNIQSVYIQNEEIENLIGLEKDEEISSIIVKTPEHNSKEWGIDITTKKVTINWKI